jgi:hypothetical protein
VQIRWTRTWAEKGGRARPSSHPRDADFASVTLRAHGGPR